MKSNPKSIRFFLLRGLAREIRHWGSFPHILKESHTCAEIIPLEIPGAGHLRNLQSPIKTEDYIVNIRSQYQQFLKLHDQCDISVIIGLSFGGMLAATWISLFPEDFQASVFINCSSRSSSFYERFRIRSALSLIQSLFTRDSKKCEKIIASCVCNVADIEVVASSWAKIRDDAPITGSNALRQLYSAARFRFPTAITIPSLILCSSKDRLVSHSCSTRIAKQLQLPLITHPTAGHDLTTDAPEWCSETINHWLEKIFP